MSQLNREPSQRSRKQKCLDTDLETEFNQDLRYEYRDTKFAFTYKKQIVITTLDSDVSPLGTTYEFKASLKPGSFTKIITPKDPETSRFLGKGPSKDISAFKHVQNERIKKGQEVELFDTELWKQGRKTSKKTKQVSTGNPSTPVGVLPDRNKLLLAHDDQVVSQRTQAGTSSRGLNLPGRDDSVSQSLEDQVILVVYLLNNQKEVAVRF